MQLTGESSNQNSQLLDGDGAQKYFFENKPGFRRESLDLKIYRDIEENIMDQIGLIIREVKDTVIHFPGGCPNDMTAEVAFGILIVPIANVTIRRGGQHYKTEAWLNIASALQEEQINTTATECIIKTTVDES